MNSCEKVASSFRDPSGFVFKKENSLFRQVNSVYKDNYDLLMGSGLYRELVESELLIPHRECSRDLAYSQGAYKVIQPEPVEFISYPYEWCFSEIKDAALVLLKIQGIALKYGMSLKDCSLYNIQFRKCKPILIDTLSFERYKEGEPWVAYRQFCQHFLATLAIMSYSDVRLSQLLRVYLDGIPLDLANSLLPFRSRLNPGLFVHLHLHASTNKSVTEKHIEKKEKQSKNFTKFKLMALINSLESAIRNLHFSIKSSQWSGYYEEVSHSPDYFQHKKEVVSSYLDKTGSMRTCWDMGANTGMYSRICADKGLTVLSFDNDTATVERNYLECIKKNYQNILSLQVDMANPSASIGWDNSERLSLKERGPADIVLASALIHHLAISNNLSLEDIASFFSGICKAIIIEFVPKDDPQIKEMLSFREDIFGNYNQGYFEMAFEKYFTINEKTLLKGSSRTLYLMHKKQPL